MPRPSLRAIVQGGPGVGALGPGLWQDSCHMANRVLSGRHKLTSCSDDVLPELGAVVLSPRHFIPTPLRA